MLELEVIRHKLQLLPQFSPVPHSNLLSGCKKEPSVFAALAAGGIPSIQHHLSSMPGLAFQPVYIGTAPLVLAGLHWFASPGDLTSGSRLLPAFTR